MKKVISIFLSLALVLTNFQGWDYINIFKNLDLFQGITQSFAETGTLLEGTGLYYTISNDEVAITDADTTISGELTIPQTIEGYPVTSIAKNAFSSCKSLTSVTIPEGVTTIYDYAFYSCSSLVSVTLPDSLTTINGRAFQFCSSLTDINIPTSVTTIGKGVFDSCTSLKNIIIPESVKEMGSGIFSKCTALESVNIPNGIKVIENNTFERCTSLKSIAIPDSVTSIGNNAFERCTSFTSVTIPDSVTSIGSSAFLYCGALKNISIPDSVTSIGKYAFHSCSSLESITIPKSVESIGEDSFYGCSKLQSIYVNDENTAFKSAGGVLFSKDLSNLIIFPAGKLDTAYTIPSGVKNIAKKAFCKCNNLVSVNIPDGVTTIGISAFQACESLTTVAMPDTVTSIGNSAFYECTNLKNINISEGLTIIGDSVFYSCTSLENVTISESVTTIESYAFEDCSSLTKITIPKGVTSIDEDAFFGCDNLTIYGYPESYAKTYAGDMEIPFVELKENVCITFDLNNGKEPIIKEIEKYSSLDYTPENPTKDGYVFVGWFKNVDNITTEYENNQTYNKNVTYTAKYAHVSMLGAQVKAVVNDMSGIRFGTKIYNDGDEILEKGTLILPYNLLAEGEALTLDTPKVARSIGKVNYEINEKENYITYLGTIVNIKRAQFDAPLTAASYVIYKDKAGNTYTVYSPYKNGFTSINKLLGQ